MAPKSSIPVGIDYLRHLGVDLSRSVKCIVATHWHNDHVRGLAETLRECTDAKFICSQALFTKEFIALTDLWRSQQLITSPVSELTGVLDTIAKSKSVLKGVGGESRLQFAIANRCLWRRHHTIDVGLDTSAELHSLSPSDAAVRKSLEAIAGITSTGENLISSVSARPNHFCIVLWLRVGEVRVLLGADMEEQCNPCGGWKLIVNSAERPDGDATLFKVPHHGSVTGECESVWKTLLLKDAIAMLTPFQSGKVSLPTKADADRICGRTPNAFITASCRDRSSRGKTGSVNRTIHETVRYIRSANDSFGCVRARSKINPEGKRWSVAIFGDAKSLKDFYPRST